MSQNISDRIWLSLPGYWIDIANHDLRFDIRHLMGLAVDQFNEAVIACELFSPLNAQFFATIKKGSKINLNNKKTIIMGIYAKAFISSLNTICSYLNVLALKNDLPEKTKGECEKFEQTFGNVRDIRDSIQHIDERVEGLAYGKKIPASVIIVGSLNENRFGFTNYKGQHVEIEISENTLEKIKLCLNRVIWSITWLGIGGFPIQPPNMEG